MEILQYPNIPTVDQVDDYHGTLVWESVSPGVLIFLEQLYQL